MSRLNIGQRRRKAPWHDHLFGVVGVLVAISIRPWLSDLGILVSVIGALGSGFVAGYVARYIAILLGERFPRLKSKHAGYLDR